MSSCIELQTLQNVGSLVISDSFSRHSATSFNCYLTAFTLSTLHSHLVSAKGLTVIFTLSFSTFHLLDEPENNVFEKHQKII
jgi:hypothetical protein